LSIPSSRLHISPPLDGHPRNRNHDIHALLLARIPLVAIRAVLLVIPVRAHGAVHATAAVLLGLRRVANVLDHGAADNVLEGGLRGFDAVGRGGGRLGDEGLQDVLLGGIRGRGGRVACARTMRFVFHSETLAWS
jgi:hypothetical protein